MYSLVLMMALHGGAATPATFGHHRGHGCHGCYGGQACYGGHGCYGYGHGCYGSGHGCYGYGGGCYGRGHGCYGHACYGGHGCYGYAGHGCYGGHHAPAAPMPPAEKIGAPPTKVGSASPAKLIVSLPAEAKLTIDDKSTVATTGTRVFTTPTLLVGKDYYYTLKVEIPVNERVETITRQVIVRAGEETKTSFQLPVATAAR